MLYPALILQGAGLANMHNTAVSLISEMIGQDDMSSAFVFATYNISESFSVGFVVFYIMGQQLNDDELSLKIVIGVLPTLCAVFAYLISYWRFNNIAIQYYGTNKK